MSEHACSFTAAQHYERGNALFRQSGGGGGGGGGAGGGLEAALRHYEAALAQLSLPAPAPPTLPPSLLPVPALDRDLELKLKLSLNAALCHLSLRNYQVRVPHYAVQGSHHITAHHMYTGRTAMTPLLFDRTCSRLYYRVCTGSHCALRVCTCFGQSQHQSIIAQGEGKRAAWRLRSGSE
jgi:hypothetical protein